MVVHPAAKDAAPSATVRDPAARLEEAIGLARAISVEIADAVILPVSKIRPSTYLGQGQVENLAVSVVEHGAGLVIVDAALSPVQQRNLETALSAKVIDRTGLILEIFGERAQTREGTLQVELAHLSYQLSRLVRSWTHLERQRGGTGFLGGPGERQIEADRRALRDRIARIKQALARVSRTRRLQRAGRKKVPYPTVALVGYTNAGKSTLFNRLTEADAMAEDMLFATLDPSLRALALPSGRKAILSDTVGFISDLPTELVAAFRATLEEVIEADLILHVRDMADPETAAQRDDVNAILGSLGIAPEAGDTRIIEVANKIDLLSEEARRQVLNGAARNPKLVAVSALSGEGVPQLLATVDGRITENAKTVRLSLGEEDGEGLAWLYRHGEVLVRDEQDGRINLTVRADPAELGRFKKRFNARFT
ncbi:MAG: GTPase HflX [Sphingomonadales bacterium]|nr:GTPase HflX [Sphingomonadales bacterium]